MSDKDDTYILSGFTLYRSDFKNFNIGTCYALPYTLKMIQIIQKFHAGSILIM